MKVINKRHLKPVAPPPADHPTNFNTFDIASLQALRDGKATEHQQSHALRLIIDHISCAGKPQYRSGKPDDTDFGLGRAFVGQEIIRALTTNLATLTQMENTHDN